LTVIQLALDRLTREKCFEIAEQTSDSIDWIEIGTGVIKEYGVGIIQEMKTRFPDKIILSDMKTCDAGKHEALQAFDNGADVTTVMGFADDNTIKDMLDVANVRGKRLMIDLLGITDTKRIDNLHRMGADLFNIHIGIDAQKNTSWSDSHFDLLKAVPKVEVAVSGGIKVNNLPLLMQHKPAILIVGSSITNATDAEEAAKAFREGVNGNA